MGEVKQVMTPLTDDCIRDLHAGDSVALSGVIYTARDKPHKILTDLLRAGKELPLELEGQLIYYVGPTPAKPGQVIGSCGPTTSSRMDPFAPTLIAEAGLKGMLGKGPRGPEVVEAMKKHNAVYLVAIGGTGVAIAQSVKKAEVIAFPELGTCAIRRLEVENLPCIVAIDSQGNNLFELGIKQYKQAYHPSED